MARFNEILVGRYNRGLQRLLSMKGGPPAAQLASEVTPQFDIERTPVELRGLFQWKRYTTGVIVPGVAAQNSVTHFRNPVNSNVLAVFEKLSLTTNPSNAQTWGFLAPGVDATNLSVAIRFDLRQEQVRSTVQVSTGNNIAVFALTMATVVSASVGVDMILSDNQEVVLGPGSTWQFAGPVNTLQLIHAIWRERALEEGEVTV